MRYNIYVETPIAKIVHRRFAIVGLFYLVLSVFSLYEVSFQSTIQGWKVGWAIVLTGCLIELLVSLGVAKKFDFQKIHVRLRSGVVIKLSFWLTILLAIGFGLATYVLFVEWKIYFWPILIAFILLLITLFISMSVRYAIDEEVKKSKVCEFC